MNNFQYNQGTELNTSTGYYETPHRLYDAALGRFMGVDAMAAIYPHQSPYHYANNNPVMYNDPTGLNYGFPDCTQTGTCPDNGVADHIRNPEISTEQYLQSSRPGGWSHDAAFNQFVAQAHAFYAWSEERRRANADADQARENIQDFINSALNGSGGSLNASNGVAYTSINMASYSNYDNYDGAVLVDYFDLGGGSLNNGFNVSPLTGALAVGELFRQARGFVDFGMPTERAEALFKNNQFRHGSKVYSNKFNGNQHVSANSVRSSKQAFNSTVKFARGFGRGMTGVSVGLSVVQFATSDQSGADYARLAGAAVITGSAFIPVVGPLISIGLGIADSYGAFDEIYNYFD